MMVTQVQGNVGSGSLNEVFRIKCLADLTQKIRYFPGRK
jgi:hypothetical protein